MLLTSNHIHVGLTVFHEGEGWVIDRIDDPHNVIGRRPNGDIALFCLVPGCELYRPLFDSMVESQACRPPKVPDSYVVQNGCHNCSKCFVKKEFDEGNEYLCNASSDRPPCDSVYMGEIPSGSLTPDDYAKESFEEMYRQREEEHDRMLLAWESWARGHAVSPSGLCHLWGQKEAV